MNFKKIVLSAQSLILVSLLGLSSMGSAFANNSKSAAKTKCKTENEIKVSVVIPVYNGKDYLDDCLNSIQNQTLKDIEIICVNDGSTDNSLEILNKHAKNDSRIKVIDKQNGGEASARQRGLEEAKGECVTFVDQDDKVDEKAYETAYNEMNAESADIVVWGWRNFTDGDNEIIRNDCVLKKKKVFKDWYKAKIERPSIYVWNKLYRRSLITENDVSFNTELRVCGDECFNLCLYPYAKKIVHIPHTFYNYRMNNNSSLFQFPFKKTFDNYRKMIEFVSEVYKKRDIKLSLFQKIRYFGIYKSEFFPIMKTWLGIGK